MLSKEEAIAKLDNAVEEFKLNNQTMSRMDLALAHDTYVRNHFGDDIYTPGSDGYNVLQHVWDSYDNDADEIEVKLNA